MDSELILGFIDHGIHDICQSSPITSVALHWTRCISKVGDSWWAYKLVLSTEGPRSSSLIPNVEFNYREPLSKGTRIFLHSDDSGFGGTGEVYYLSSRDILKL